MAKPRMWVFLSLGTAGALALSIGVGGAEAQQAPPPAEAAPAPEAPAAPATPTLSSPSMTAPLALNPNPLKFDAGPLGTVYGSAILTGLGFVQSNPVLGDRHGYFDISNGQAIVQTTEGLVQFYAQAGIYSFPSLGTPYLRASKTNSAFYGPLPVGYLKLAPSDTFSIQGGQLPTLIGAEYAFTFQNMNIERGLLWNQEPVISRGVQANYTAGPLLLQASFNDGFYSDRFNWLVGAATYTIDSSQSIELVGGGALGNSTVATLSTPLPQDNGEVANVIYTFNAAPWTLSGYMQYTHVPRKPKLGLFQDASTAGGAVLVNYAFSDNFSLAGRAEVIGSTGELIKGAPNLLYGPGSAAFSLTATPTWQWGRFFVRGEGSLVLLDGTVPGFAFGHTGTAKNQGRFLVEAGFIF